jgi:hypothetical protein
MWVHLESFLTAKKEKPGLLNTNPVDPTLKLSLSKHNCNVPKLDTTLMIFLQ